MAVPDRSSLGRRWLIVGWDRPYVVDGLDDDNEVSAVNEQPRLR
jgi:hypothetical protein